MTIYSTNQLVERPDYLGGLEWSLSGLTDVTVLMGKNGAGKSVLLRAWRDMHPHEIHYVAPERTGEMGFAPQFLQQEADGAQRRNVSVRNFAPNYRQRILVRVQTYFMTRGNHRGQGAAPGNPAELEQFLALLIPDFDVTIKAASPPYSIQRLAGAITIDTIDKLSSGEAQLLTIGLDMLSIAAMWEIEERAQRIILLDEPDAHIHPDLQTRFAEFVLQLIDRFKLQIVVATHSTSLLSAFAQFGGTRTSVAYVERNGTALEASPFDEATKQIASCLGGHVLMGPLFGAPLLLVEGDDDYRIWSQVPRHHVVKLAVIPCNGEEIFHYQAALEKILGSLCERRAKPTGFAVLDGDKAVPAASPAKPQDFVRFIGLGCHEAENLYLTNMVLHDIGHTWDTAKAAILARAGEFGQKAEALRQCVGLDRQTGDFKDVITQIAVILDTKQVPWTQRVGVAIGRARPAEDLALFLGQPILDALWPAP